MRLVFLPFEGEKSLVTLITLITLIILLYSSPACRGGGPDPDSYRDVGIGGVALSFCLARTSRPPKEVGVGWYCSEASRKVKPVSRTFKIFTSDYRLRTFYTELVEVPIFSLYLML